MYKYRAAAAGDAGPDVVIDLDEQIVEPVIPPKAVAWFMGRSLKGLIIAPIGRIFAPGVSRTDTA
jgi:hypothetical protein